MYSNSSKSGETWWTLTFFTQFEYVDFNVMLQLIVVNLNVGVMFFWCTKYCSTVVLNNCG